MDRVGSGPRDNVYDSPRGPAVFRSVTVRHDLEFLHCLLRNSGAHAVYRSIRGVRAVDVHQVGARALAADV